MCSYSAIVAYIVILFIHLDLQRIPLKDDIRLDLRLIVIVVINHVSTNLLNNPRSLPSWEIKTRRIIPGFCQEVILQLVTIAKQLGERL